MIPIFMGFVLFAFFLKLLIIHKKLVLRLMYSCYACYVAKLRTTCQSNL